MANLHVRSNSLPSKSHPVATDVEDQLCRLRSSEGTSTSATSVTATLASLRDVHEGSVQDLQSSIRRNRGEIATPGDMTCYMTSRKNINKMVNKFIKNSKVFNKNPTAFSNEDSDLKAIVTMLKETEAFDVSVLKSVLILVSGERGSSKKRSWSLLSKFTRTNRVHSEVEQERGADYLCSLDLQKSGKDLQNVLELLKASEMAIQELEEELEAFFRSLVKTRVSLLNAINH
ncbi:uncharacterized protein LOC105155413 [Sesamum indicum]|uniref:Uncharacterized protein LOC105155413 n=1 Tax=Sesamum indicum TaxID=4182 RepID=A0A6I9SKN4_SESIN|nr:uncharacterized protein LOC105155413 [Sesamum indicum]